MSIGILGGGQLGRMLALAGIPLGQRFVVLEPGGSVPADAVASRVVGEYEEYASLAEFVGQVDRVTYEFENVPVRSARWLAERVPVYPPPLALEIAQDRVLEKQFFTRCAIPVPAFQAIHSRADYEHALETIGLPCVLKTCRFGYDGKGQAVIRDTREMEPAWERLGGRPLILEQCVPFDRELSILAVRGQSGECTFYPLVENEHRHGILFRSLAPVLGLDDRIVEQARIYARTALENLNYVGLLAIEFFQVGSRLLANEMAPRVHNSGHWTIEGAETSQFENHLRACLGWPLGLASARAWHAMFNLIGTLPDREAILGIPGTHWHDYTKPPRPGRKLGHVTLSAPDPETLAERMARVQAALQIP